MTPTEKQLEFIDDLRKMLLDIHTTNDIESPTILSDWMEMIEYWETYYSLNKIQTEQLIRAVRNILITTQQIN